MIHLRKLIQKGQLWKRSFVHSSTDFPSINQCIDKHVELMVKRKQLKSWVTDDQKTVKICHEILKDKPFLKKTIMQSWQKKDSINETKSLIITISPIENYPEYLQVYDQWKQEGKRRVIGVGGPAATDQALLCSLIPTIRENVDVHYYCRSFAESNVAHSGLQSHARQAMSYSNVPEFWGIRMLPKMLKKMLITPTFEELSDPDFSKNDIYPYSLNFWRVAILYELQSYRQWILGELKIRSEASINKIEGLISQAIQISISEAEKIRIYNEEESYQNRDIEFNSKSLEEMTEKEKQEKVNFCNLGKPIKMTFLSFAEMKDRLPHLTSTMKSGMAHYGEYKNSLGLFDVVKEASTRNGVVWNDKMTIKKIFLKQNPDTGRPEMAGVLLETDEFIPADSAHFTVGYKGDFVYENTNKSPIKSQYIPGTGVSFNFLIKKTPQIKQSIEKYKKIFLLSTKNIHWTPLEENDDYFLLRSTAGAHMGSETYKPAVALNLIYLTKKIYGESLVGILSTYGCCRSINPKNSCQLVEVAKGLVVTYGKGGTGHTRRTVEALFGLYKFGFGKEVEEYFKNIENKRADTINIIEDLHYVMNSKDKFGLFYSSEALTKSQLYR